MEKSAETEGEKSEEKKFKVALFEAEPDGPREEDSSGDEGGCRERSEPATDEAAGEEQGCSSNGEHKRGSISGDGVAAEAEDEMVGDGERGRVHEDGGLLEESGGMEEAKLRGEIKQISEIAVGDGHSGGVRAIVMGAVETENEGEKQGKKRVNRGEDVERLGQLRGFGGGVHGLVWILARS